MESGFQAVEGACQQACSGEAGCLVNTLHSNTRLACIDWLEASHAPLLHLKLLQLMQTSSGCFLTDRQPRSHAPACLIVLGIEMIDLIITSASLSHLVISSSSRRIDRLSGHLHAEDPH